MSDKSVINDTTKLKNNEDHTAGASPRPIRGVGGLPAQEAYTAQYEDSLSPNTQRKFDHLRRQLIGKEVHLEEDGRGDMSIIKDKERDPANANFNVNLRSHVGVLEQASCDADTRDEKYELGEVLGQKNVRSIKYPSGEERVLKPVDSKFLRVSEPAAMLDVHGSEYFPKLYKVDLIMEKIDGETVAWLIKNMTTLRKQQPELILPVSLSIFHGVLSALHLLLTKNWVHGDIHAGNVMVTADSLAVKVLDLGNAKRPDGPTFRRDVLDLIRLLCRLLIPSFHTWGCYKVKSMDQKEIITNQETRKAVKEAMNLTLIHEPDQAEMEAMNATPDQAEMVLELIEQAYNAVECAKEGRCGDLQPVMASIDKKMPAKERETARKEAAAILFPQCHDHSTGVDGATPEDGTGMNRHTEPVDMEGLHLDERDDDFDTKRDRERAVSNSTPSEPPRPILERIKSRLSNLFH